VDYVWRLCLGLGAVPALLGAYYRAKLPETPRFTAHVIGDTEQAKKDINQVLEKEHHQREDEEKLVPAAKSNVATFDDFIAHYSKWRNLKVLIGCAGAWFMLDVAFYGLGLNQSIILNAIGFSKKLTHYETLFSMALGNCVINLMGSLPGYWVTVALVEKLGRVKIQLIGFGVLTVIFAVLAIAYKQILHQALGLFIFLYCLGQFFFNFGPNATTFIIPGEAFPTRFRSTSHGICAATGKLGAMVSSFGFTYMVSSNNEAQTETDIRKLLGIFSIFMLAGLLLTLLINETKGKSLEEISEEGDAPLNRTKNRYSYASIAASTST